MKRFSLFFAGMSFVACPVSAEYLATPHLGDDAAYNVKAISEDEYNQNVSGSVYKVYEVSGNDALVPQYYQYEVNEDKTYNETVSQIGQGSGDGENPDVDAGVGLNNTGDISGISGTLYKDNKYSYDFTGTDVDTYVRGGAVYNGGVIGQKDGNGQFTGVSIEADFIGNSLKTQTQTEGLLRAQGGALANQGEIGNIQGDFIQNSADGRYAWGGALYNDKIASIGNIYGDFVGNFVGGESSGGGAIINEGSINNLQSDFIANHVDTSSYAAGGAIHNNDQGYIAEINGNFIDNYAQGAEQAYGGAIDNLSGTIGDINGDFNNNHAVSDEVGRYNGAFGGAISNQEGALSNLNGNFYGNFVSSQIYAQGGAIFNSSGSIDNIRGDFIQNQANSDNASAYGGAIYNETAVIKSINGDFSENTASAKLEALGGAIYSMNGTDSGNSLNIVNSNFYNNTAVSADEKAKGGAIYADNLTITAQGNDSIFRGNKADNKSNAIYMDGSVNKDAAILNLVTKENGDIVFDDAIDGNNYDVNLSGDGSGEVIFNNMVDNVNNFNLSGLSAFHLGKDAQVNMSNYVANNDGGTPILTLDVEVDKTANAINNGLLNISGDVSGTTNVIVNSLNQNILDDITDAKTIFVQAPNDDLATESKFNVSRVIGSPYMWDSIRNYGGETEGSNWYLVVRDNSGGDDGSSGNESSGDVVYAPEIPAYVGMQSAVIEQNRGIGRKIASGLRAEQNKGCCDRKFQHKYNMWIDADYDNAELDAPTHMDASIQGVTAGVDFKTNKYSRLGAFAAYRQGDYDLSGKGKYAADSGSSLDIDSYLGGLYYHYGRYNWAVLATVFAGTQDVNMETDDGVAFANTDAMQYGASLEVAKKFYLPYAWIVEPSAGLYYSALDLDGFRDNMGKQVDFDLMHYIEAELGLRFEHLFCLNGGTAKVYAKPSIIQTYASGDSVNISGLDAISTYDNQLLGRMELGAKFGLSRSLSAYASANYTFGSDYSGYGIDAGLNYAW